MDAVVTSQVQLFFSQYKLRSYSKGQILLLNGDTTNYVYYLVKGKVKQYDVTYRGDEMILNTFKPPAFFPMSLAINKVENPYIYEAETGVDIRQAPAGEVVRFLKSHPDVLYDLLSRVYYGADCLLGRITQLMSGSAQSRLIYELILEARRFGIYDENKKGCALKITEKDLGAHAGLSRETISREIHKLKTDGMITMRNKSLYISSMRELELKLGQVI